MSSKGTLASWNDEKGYGFISTGQGKERVFVHIKAFDRPGRRPVAGDMVTFSLSADARGRPCAKEAVVPSGVLGHSHRELRSVRLVVYAGRCTGLE